MKKTKKKAEGRESGLQSWPWTVP